MEILLNEIFLKNQKNFLAYVFLEQKEKFATYEGGRGSACRLEGQGLIYFHYKISIVN